MAEYERSPGLGRPAGTGAAKRSEAVSEPDRRLSSSGALSDEREDCSFEAADGCAGKPDLKSMYMDELTEFVKDRGLPAFRARQLFQWIHRRRASSYDQMSNLPAGLRRGLEASGPLVAARVEDLRVSKIDGTRKYLFRMPDGVLVESVLMRYKFGNSVCISSQAGCRMGCAFCASTLHGLVRSLSASEMLEQVYAIARDTGEPVTHVVVMGMGEPLDNYDALVRFLRLLTDPDGMNLSQRSVTVSTCGIVPNIYRLAGEGLHVTLALSLHAATDERRRRIMPVAKKWSISQLMEACAFYYKETGRQVTFEYSLIRGVNDDGEDARLLSALVRPLKAHVNLIPVNPVRERGFEHPDDARVKAFKKELENRGVNVSIRRALGKDIEGACGQLRNRHLQ